MESKLTIEKENIRKACYQLNGMFNYPEHMHGHQLAGWILDEVAKYTAALRIENRGLRENQIIFHGPRPKIVCLCGSTRFKEQFIETTEALTMQGRIVLSVGRFGHVDGYPTTSEKIMLDELHKRKIDMADEVWILNVGGYIGESTRSELDYALEHGKAVFYLEPTALVQGGPDAD